MIDALFNQPNMLAAKRLLDMTALRHEAISSNLANIETPSYKRVDVAPSFTDELKMAIAARDQDRLDGMRPTLAVDSTAKARRADGNSVDLEHELIELNRNSLEHAVEVQVLTGAMLRLKTAIHGRPA